MSTHFCLKGWKFKCLLCPTCHLSSPFFGVCVLLLSVHPTSEPPPPSRPAPLFSCSGKGSSRTTCVTHVCWFTDLPPFSLGVYLPYPPGVCLPGGCLVSVPVCPGTRCTLLSTQGPGVMKAEGPHRGGARPVDAQGQKEV